MIIYLVEIVGVNGSGTPTTFRYSDGTGYTTKPADTPANTYYAPRLRQPCLFEKSCHGGARTHGLAPIGRGSVELENSDGALDGLVEYGFDGQTLLVKRGDDAAALSTFTTVFQGTIEQPELRLASVIFRSRDALQNLDVPLQSDKFAGSNSLPNGLEGVSDLAGKPKPICFGINYNISPPCVNTDRLIYQVHYKGLVSYPAGTYASMSWTLSVYDKRVAITRGAEKTLTQMGAGATTFAFTVDTATDILSTGASNHGFTTADGVSVLADSGATLPAPLADNVTYYARVLSATTVSLHPTAAFASSGSSPVNFTTVGTGTFTISNNRTARGNYDYCLDYAGGTYFRLGSAPVGQVTCDVTNGSDTSPAGRHLGVPAGIVPALIAVAKPAQSVNMASGTYLSTASSVYRSLGIYIDSETTVLKALGEVLNGLRYFIDGGSNGPDIGNISMGQVTYVSTTTALTLTERDIIDIERVASRDDDAGIPSFRFNLRYKKNYTVMSRDQLVVGTVTEAVIARLAQEWLISASQDTGVKTKYPNSPEITQDSLLNDTGDAIDESLARRQFYDGRHDIFRVVVAADKALGLGLGRRVDITHPRFGLSTGAYAWVLSASENFASNRTELLLLK